MFTVAIVLDLFIFASVAAASIFYAAMVIHTIRKALDNGKAGAYFLFSGVFIVCTMVAALAEAALVVYVAKLMGV